jgi:hypothetical protein
MYATDASCAKLWYAQSEHAIAERAEFDRAAAVSAVPGHGHMPQVEKLYP